MNIESKQQSLLTFRVGPVLCCAPSLPVQSIITPPKLTHIAGSDASQPGIFKYGSHIVKVIDLRLKFGIEPSEQTQPGNLIITIIGNESFAFWVDQILDVFDFPAEGWGNLPAAIPRGVFSRTLLLNTKIHLYSEFDKLATIRDLGYLKHYIQQLTEQEIKDTALEISDESSRLNSASPINTDKKEKEKVKIETIKTEIEADQYGDQGDQGVRAVEKKQFQRIRPLVAKQAATTSSYIKEKAASATKITSLPRTQQQAIATPNINREANTQVKPKLQTTISKPAENKSLTNTSSQKISYAHSNSTDVEDDTDSSLPGVFLFLIFIFTLLGTGLYFFFDDDVINRYEFINEQHVNSEPSFNAEKTQPAEIPLATKQHSISHVTNESLSTGSTGSTGSAHDINENPEISALNIKETPSESNAFRADISQLEDEITITIHQPNSHDQHAQQEQQESSAQEILPIALAKIDDVIQSEPVITAPAVETLKREELSPVVKPEKIIHEVIHTVVKGDTLWAIAKKYVHDPFLYPELARLSNIKNPHRIYPGNRVRIRFINN